MELRFSGEVVEWRGPAPHLFVPLPEREAAEVDDVRAQVTYGWGAVPVTAVLGATTWTTSLFPKDGTYLLPLKVAVRRAEQVDLGDAVDVVLTLALRER